MNQNDKREYSRTPGRLPEPLLPRPRGRPSYGGAKDVDLHTIAVIEQVNCLELI